MGKVKVLQIGLSSYPGGVENSVMNYYRFMDREKVQFDFVCTESSLAYGEEILALDGEIFYLPSPKRNICAFAKALKRLINDRAYDAVHVNMLSAINVYPAVFAKQTKVKRIIAHAHNANLPGSCKRIAHSIIKRFVPLFANEQLACSHAAAVWMFGSKGAEKTHIVKNAIDYGKFCFDEKTRRQMRSRYGIKENELLIGHVGRFGEEKNQKFLVERFSEIKKRVPQARLLLVGDGKLQQIVKQQTIQLGVSDDVIFCSGVDNTAPFYQMMDVFCMPSLFEGLGIAAIEAQISGLPCVCSTGVPEATIITKNAKRVDLNDPDQWVSSMLDAMKVKRTGVDSQEARFAGYSIANEAVRLQEYYVKGIMYETT